MFQLISAQHHLTTEKLQKCFVSHWFHSYENKIKKPIFLQVWPKTETFLCVWGKKEMAKQFSKWWPLTRSKKTTIFPEMLSTAAQYHWEMTNATAEIYIVHKHLRSSLCKWIKPLQVKKQICALSSHLFNKHTHVEKQYFPPSNAGMFNTTTACWLLRSVCMETKWLA